MEHSPSTLTPERSACVPLPATIRSVYPEGLTTPRKRVSSKSVLASGAESGSEDDSALAGHGWLDNGSSSPPDEDSNIGRGWSSEKLCLPCHATLQSGGDGGVPGRFAVSYLVSLLNAS